MKMDQKMKQKMQDTQPKQMNNPYYHESYSNLVYQSACDKLKKKFKMKEPNI